MSGRSSSIAIAAGLVAISVLGCGDSGPDPGDRPGSAEVGAPAPAYHAVTLGGDSVSLADLQGEVVLLNVWATWCAPCRQEIPELQALHEEHGSEGLRVVGVTVDARGAEPQVRRFLEEFGVTYDIWWDPDQTAVSTFDAVGVPLTVVIGRDGRIAWRRLGALRRGDPGLVDALESTLDEPAG